MKKILSFGALLLLQPIVAQGQLHIVDEPSTTVRAGDTLSVIANSRYGSRSYAGFLEVYNRVDPKRLRIGMNIETPKLSDGLRSSGVSEVIPAESEMLAKLVADFRSLELEIRKNRFSNDGLKVYHPLSADLLKRLSAFSSEISTLRENLEVSKVFSDNDKEILITKLKEATDSARNISAISSDGYALDIERVHRRFDSVLKVLVGFAYSA